MQIEDHGIIFDASQRSASERVASFTALCPLSSGAMLCAFQVGSAKNALDSTLRICRSRDQGRTWQELGFRFQNQINGVLGCFSAGEMVEVQPGRILLVATWFDRGDPKLPVFDPVTEGLLPTKQLAAYSANEGETWTPWREISITALKGCSITGPFLQWSDGAIAYPFESYKEFGDTRPATHGAWFIVSRDQGATFGPPVLVAQDPRSQIYYWDQRLCAGKIPGEYIGLFWTHDLEHKKDLPVHLRKHASPHGSFPDTPVASTGIPGQIAAPLLLKDGRLLAFVVDRSKPGTMTLWCSEDGGANWPRSLVVHVHEEQAQLTQGKENIDYAQYWEDMGKWSFGHPAVRLLGNGKILVAFYSGVPNCLSIHWARIKGLTL